MVFNDSEGGITLPTQESSDLTGGMVMIDYQLLPLPTYGASTLSLIDQKLVIILCKTILLPTVTSRSLP
jgi:hypothetical protein